MPVVPNFSLSDKNKDRLRRFDDTRPYIHRAAMFALPAMAAGNYLVPKSLEAHKHKILAGLGAAGAAAGLLDRKIEHLAEQHEELRPVLKSYSKSPSAPVQAPIAKAASAMTRVARNRDELTEMFPGTMAARVAGLQKEAFNVNPQAVGSSISKGMSFLSSGKGHVPGAVIGGALGAMRGASTAERGHGIGGAVKGGLVGAGLGFGASKGLQVAASSAPVRQAVGGAVRNLRTMGSAPVSAGQAFERATAGGPNGLGARPTRPVTFTREPSMRTFFAKKAGMDTTHEGERPISGRAPFAALSSAAEMSNDAVINQMLRGLYANTDAMRMATEEQVMAAFPMSGPHSYGRHRAIGRTADDIKAEIALGYTPKR